MENYQHYIAVDWSMASMAIARMTGQSDKITEREAPTSLAELKTYLKALKGKAILMFEESNNAQWLYTELKDFVERILICDPYRNRLLSEGAKTDKIDARKLVQLLRAGLVKEVYHSGEHFIYVRKLTSHYQDLVRSGVRMKNQRSALFRSYGLDHKKDEFSGDSKIEDFVLAQLDNQIESYQRAKQSYEEKIKSVVKTSQEARLLKDIPGIGDIHAVEILATVVDAKRFPTAGHFLSYCGLITHEKISGGKSYGNRKTHYHRRMKAIFKMATFTCVGEGSNNPVATYYRYLSQKKNYPPYKARHACARKIACYAYGVLKTKTKFKARSFAKE